MKQWIETLVTVCGKQLYHFCCHLTGSRDAADDLYQETFLKVMEKEGVLLKIMAENDVHTQQGMEKTRNYLIGIAVRLWRYHCRKESRRKQIAPEDRREEAVLELTSGDTGPEGHYLEKESRTEFHELLAGLSEKLRIVAVLFYAQELSTREIAECLSVPEATVRSRLNRARKKLKEAYELQTGMQDKNRPGSHELFLRDKAMGTPRISENRSGS